MSYCIHVSRRIRSVVLWMEKHLSFMLQNIRLQWVFKLWQECYYVFKACFPELPWESFYLHPSLSSCHCCQCNATCSFNTEQAHEKKPFYDSTVFTMAGPPYSSLFPQVAGILACWLFRTIGLRNIFGISEQLGRRIFLIYQNWDC